MRIIPDRSNAGCYKELAVHDGCEGDWTQYEFVPYYLDACADAVSSDLSIQKVYITNDMSNLYIRVDNESGSLPAYCAETVFQVGAHIPKQYRKRGRHYVDPERNVFAAQLFKGIRQKQRFNNS